MIDRLLRRVRGDRAFAAIECKFAEAKVESWLQDEEKALLFAVAAFVRGKGMIVEIGSHHGGSACFLAARAGTTAQGSARRASIPISVRCSGSRRLRISTRSRYSTRRRQPAAWPTGSDVRVGESSAIAAIWPAEPIDAVFIDGDHSFLGALKDFECWAPKVRPGGLVLIDDTDGPWVPGLLELAALVKTLGSVRVLGQVQGITICERTRMPAQAMIGELSRACAAKQVYRPWNLLPLHDLGLPRDYAKSRDWSDGSIDLIYQLGFLSCSGGILRLLRRLAAGRPGGPPCAEPGPRRRRCCRAGQGGR